MLLFMFVLQRMHKEFHFYVQTLYDRRVIHMLMIFTSFQLKKPHMSLEYTIFIDVRPKDVFRYFRFPVILILSMIR